MLSPIICYGNVTSRELLTIWHNYETGCDELDSMVWMWWTTWLTNTAVLETTSKPFSYSSTGTADKCAKLLGRCELIQKPVFHVNYRSNIKNTYHC